MTQSLEELLQKRIVVFDGAMGTMIQRYRLSEADYRGTRFADHPQDLKGNPNILCITRPDVITGIHEAYLESGADIIETNTFGATRIVLSEYKLDDLAYEVNVAAARLARAAADAAIAKAPDRPRFVAGSIGPLNRMLSMSPRVNDPTYHAVSFDQV